MSQVTGDVYKRQDVAYTLLVTEYLNFKSVFYYFPFNELGLMPVSAYHDVSVYWPIGKQCFRSSSSIYSEKHILPNFSPAVDVLR